MILFKSKSINTSLLPYIFRKGADIQGYYYLIYTVPYIQYVGFTDKYYLIGNKIDFYNLTFP